MYLIPFVMEVQWLVCNLLSFRRGAEVARKSELNVMLRRTALNLDTFTVTFKLSTKLSKFIELTHP